MLLKASIIHIKLCLDYLIGIEVSILTNLLLLLLLLVFALFEASCSIHIELRLNYLVSIEISILILILSLNFLLRSSNIG